LSISPAVSSPGIEPLPGVEPGGPADAPEAARPLPKRLSLLVSLLLLTLISAAGGFLRFWRLGFQSYWTDEAYTIARIRGTFAEMLQQLNDQGFPPGWYALLQWWCNALERYTGDGAFAFSPVGTRLLPAILGTLTVPAMYFLGRQFFERRGAMLVALLAAVNPFLIYYSRDIKMYAALVLFVTLNMGVFFRWQTTHRHWLWLPLYVLTGAAMLATQAVGWFIVVLQLIFLLTRPRPRWLDGPMWLAGVALISLLPWYWYTEYVQPAKWMNRVSGAVPAGTNWYPDYTNMSWKTLAGLPTSHLLGYLWPVYPPDEKITQWFVLGADFKEHLATRSSPELAQWELYAAWGLFAILILGLVPWRGWRWWGGGGKSPERLASVTRGRWWWVAIWILLPTALLALTWIPKDSPWFAKVWQGFDVKPIWEPRYLAFIVPAWILWLGASIGRFPTWPVRWIVGALVVGASVGSALTNHLVYRNVPYGRAAEIAERFTPKEDRLAVAVAVPISYHVPPSENAALTVARHLRPGSPEDTQYVAARYPKLWTGGTVLWNTLSSPSTVRSWLAINATRARYHTLVLTDAHGDLDDPAGPLSNASIAKTLGPGWTLVHEESYRLYFEWRFYIFSTWRTRVWKRVDPPSPPASPPPASQPAAAAAAAPAGAATRPAVRPATRPAAQPAGAPATRPSVSRAGRPADTPATRRAVTPGTRP
jgi:4-amino-4-deoxy-L-arabinose transferase-like glycosyltransferase